MSACEGKHSLLFCRLWDLDVGDNDGAVGIRVRSWRGDGDWAKENARVVAVFVGRSKHGNEACFPNVHDQVAVPEISCPNILRAQTHKAHKHNNAIRSPKQKREKITGLRLVWWF